MSKIAGGKRWLKAIMFAYALERVIGLYRGKNYGAVKLCLWGMQKKFALCA
jgi:hypothetical protein